MDYSEAIFIDQLEVAATIAASIVRNSRLLRRGANFETLTSSLQLRGSLNQFEFVQKVLIEIQPTYEERSSEALKCVNSVNLTLLTNSSTNTEDSILEECEKV